MWLEQLIARHMINLLPFAVTLYNQAVVRGGKREGEGIRRQERLTAALPLLWNVKCALCVYFILIIFILPLPANSWHKELTKIEEI